MYIVFEGIVGSGKTTQSKKYTEYLKQKFPQKEVIWTREPGGTEIADVIRKVVQATKFEEEMEFICEAYLYAASRAQSLRKIVKPVLDKGGIVVSDRNFITSLTNQAYGRELGLDQVLAINMPAIKDFIPHKIVFFDIPIEVALKRISDEGGDKFETLGSDFYKRVSDGYRELQRLDLLKDNWINIDAQGTQDEVFSRVVDALGF